MYDQDGLTSVHNHDFMADSSFISAYQRGVSAAGVDYNWHWRVHIGLWAARTSVCLDGDFIECGTNAGFMSSSIMYDLKWDETGKHFYLLDTFRGLDPKYCSEQEIKEGILEKNKELKDSGFYIQSVEGVKKNFSEWENHTIIEGAIPETLEKIKADKVSFLHIDLNCAPPEVAVLDFLWGKLVAGAIVLLDDYAYSGYHNQKYAMDDYACSRNVSIVSLPTGQGLLIKT